HPDRATGFTARLDHYERALKKLNLSDEELAILPEHSGLAARTGLWALLGLALAPIALCGWLHRLIPILVVRWAQKRFGRKAVGQPHASPTAIIAGTVSFTVFYAACVAVVHHFFGWPVSLWYALSLPVTGLIAHYYLRAFRKF